MKLTVLGQDSIVVTFTSMKQTVRVTVSANGCPHGIPHYKKVKHRINRDEEWCALNRSVVYTKKQFQKTLSRFINYILLAAGLREISRPRPTQRKTIVSEAKAAVTPRGKAGEGEVHSLTLWKALPSNCPLLLQKLLQKQDIGRGCRCFVKPPQCWRDPYCLLRYDLNSPLQEDPPLLVKNNAVVQGMVLVSPGPGGDSPPTACHPGLLQPLPLWNHRCGRGEERQSVGSSRRPGGGPECRRSDREARST
ncbi:uncharacterized protein C3orf20 homolog [Diceros bicornis minor]|uniref:uncharacterized protein C3orf20 homolog n=1 Tax=Diceros bicornis minor TaxID=77932 RepID=UPI0026F19CEA|nr:uncharacterized protein C3orf20 homolog [Diceros bicornis minor]